jgi:hypothetical protein
MPNTSDTAGAALSSHAYILLDRTGSMSAIWEEALGSVNAYADSLFKPEGGAPAGADHRITLAVFDHQAGLQFDVLRKAVPAAAWRPVTSQEASPRGMTPLFDAVARLVALAEADNPQKAILVIMTDGEENAFREVTRDGAKAALARAEAKGWEVVFLGAEFAKVNDSEAIGVLRGKTMAMSKENLDRTMRSLASKSRAYFSAEAASVDFSEEDRREAGEEDVKRRKGN